jgi:hypothetical protein
MLTNKHRVLGIAILALAGGALVSGCNDTAFSVSSGASLGQVDPLCQVGTSTKNLRILFMIDDSGSTLTTDPDKNYRVATIQKFIQDYGGNSNLSYTFGYFSGTTAQEFDVLQSKFVGGVASNPVGDSGQLSTALLTYEAHTSSGNTPYKAAFNSLTDTVIADENSGARQDYVVVFMSDGQPTDISGSSNLNGLVTSLKTAAAGNGSNLLLSTVYFGDENDSKSISNLTGMAQSGGGQFVDTNRLAQGGLVINDIISIPGCKPASSVAAKSVSAPVGSIPSASTARAPASLLTVKKKSANTAGTNPLHKGS